MSQHRLARLERVLSLSLLLGLALCVLLGVTLLRAGAAAAEPAGTRDAATVLRDTAYRFFIGNLHSHTSYSDGTGTPAWAYRYARDTARIDFLAVTDHHDMLSELEYEDVLFQADEHCEDGVFVAIAGQEWSGGDTATGRKDHATVLGADHMGIIHQIARYLSEQGINLETMTTEVVAAPMSGTPLFTMSAIVKVPPRLEIEDLREALEFIGDDLGVDTKVRTMLETVEAFWPTAT